MMKAFFKSILKISPICILLSCDCMVTAKGTVLDADSKLPLEGVLVRNLISSEDGDKTKSDGVFDKVEIGRAHGKCPEFNLEFSKEGYFSDTVFIESTQLQIIYLKQNK